MATTETIKPVRTSRAQKRGEQSKFTAIHMPEADRALAEREAAEESRSLSSYLLQCVRLGQAVKQQLRARQKVAGSHDIDVAVRSVADGSATVGQH